MIFEINKIDSRKQPLKSLQSKSKARRSHPWLFQSLSKPQVYLVTPLNEVLFFMKNTYKKHTESITITYLNTILVTIEVIEMEYLFIFLESFFQTSNEED